MKYKMRRLNLRRDGTVPRGAEASRLRQRKHALRRAFHLPKGVDEMLLGTLTLTHVRCGKPTCHCATGEGHPAWHLTVQVGGRPRVIHIPAVLVEEIQRRVAAGRAFHDAVREVFAANAALFVLARQQQRGRR
jgi:hypothetical protein